MHVGIAGEVRCVVTKADGTVTADTGYQKNLILNQGLDFFGGDKGSSINASCAIGSGNSIPAVTQTKLDTFIALTSGEGTTSDYSYVDKGDGLYRIWEQKKYRFTNLDNVNISELGLVSTGSTSENYYLTTRALIKDSAGAPTSISVKKGETLDIYYKIHKVVDISDKSSVIDVLDGSGGAIPYNVVIRPAQVGVNGKYSVGKPFGIDPGYSDIFLSSNDIKAVTNVIDGNISGGKGLSKSAYVANSLSIKLYLDIPLNLGIGNIRSVALERFFEFFPFQMRLGRVSDDAPLTKTNKDTLTIPLEFSWGRYEGEL